MIRLADPPTGYPWRAVLLAAGIVLILLLIGTWLIDAAFAWGVRNERYEHLTGTCYFAGDVRNYTRIALNGYTDYTAALNTPHMTLLNERSWWPLFPNITARLLPLMGRCTTRTLNALCYLALVPVFQAITRERRAWVLAALGLMPFGAWFYIGQADTFFLVLSGLLVWVIGQSERLPRRAGVAALIVGLLIGLAKPNGLALIPPLLVWGILLARRHGHAQPDGTRRWIWMLGDGNPAWATVLAVIAILLGNGWWIYQTSGEYPFYVLMLQRTLWFREFEGGSPASFLFRFYRAVHYARSGLITMDALVRLVELANIVYGLALIVSRLPPRWPGDDSPPIPLHWRLGVVTVYAAMFLSGQSHAVERYAASNIFVLLVWWQVVFAGRGSLRWLWVLLGPVLWGLSFLILGWGPLET